MATTHNRSIQILTIDWQMSKVLRSSSSSSKFTHIPSPITLPFSHQPWVYLALNVHPTFVIYKHNGFRLVARGGIEIYLNMYALYISFAEFFWYEFFFFFFRLAVIYYIDEMFTFRVAFTVKYYVFLTVAWWISFFFRPSGKVIKRKNT